MKVRKVNIGVMGSPSLKQALCEQAQFEGRTTSNLSERLLVWAVSQLTSAGNTQTLMTWRALPIDKGKSGFAGPKKNRFGIYHQVTTQAEDFARAVYEMAEPPSEGGHEQRPGVSQKEIRHSGRPRRRAHS